MKHISFRAPIMNKAHIISKVLEILEDRIVSSQEELNSIKDAIAAETKSSAGDKFETSREMMNQSKDKLLNHIAELNKQKTILKLININLKKESVSPGALIQTSNGNFLISSSFGKVEIEDKIVMLISTASPLFQEMKRMHVKDSFEFRNRKYEILSID